MVDVTNFLDLAHFADGAEIAQVIDQNACPAPVRHS